MCFSSITENVLSIERNVLKSTFLLSSHVVNEQSNNAIFKAGRIITFRKKWLAPYCLSQQRQEQLRHTFPDLNLVLPQS